VPSLLASIGDERAPQTDTNLIEIVTRSSWRSSGTVVRVALAPVAEGTQITIAAWPGAQLFDWGESRRTARSVADALRGDS
jgi:type II secretory pathway component PulM